MASQLQRRRIAWMRAYWECLVEGRAVKLAFIPARQQAFRFGEPRC